MTKNIRQCLHCNQTFTLKRDTAKYCCRRCKENAKNKRKYQPKTPKVVKCKICCNSFAPATHNALYCGDECRKVAERSYRQTYYEENKDKIKADLLRWRLENPDKWGAVQEKWREKNPDRVAAIVGKAHAVYRAGPDCIPADFTLTTTIPFCAEARRLTRETGTPYEVDHIIPLAGGGLHCPSNLQVLTEAENRAKGNKLPDEYSEEMNLQAA